MTSSGHELARTIAASLPDCAVTAFDRELVIRLADGGAMRRAGFDPAEVEGLPVVAAVPPPAYAEVERHYRAALDGESGHFTIEGDPEYEVTVVPSHAADGTVDGGVAIWKDVTDHRRTEARLRHLADHDPLTGLLNRRAFELELERHLALTRRYGATGALLLLDVDHFKYVNDTLGHGAGDDLIILIASALRGRLRDTDVLARLGGDEFAVLLPRADAEGACTVAQALVDDLRGHVRGSAEDRLRPVTVSVGVALVTTGAERPDELLARADLAMYDAKEAGRDRFATYAGEDHDEPAIRSRMRWMERIQEAIEQDRFILHAQPIVDLASGRVVEHELLVRMLSPTGDIVPPAAFLPVAERFGLIEGIDRLVVAKAIALAAERRAAGDLAHWSLNLSAKSITTPGLIDHIAESLERTGLDPSALTFEITETAAVTNVAHARTFAEHLHALGCKLSLDDFGAGFGSFYYLKHLPFDVLKIDGEFVSGCVHSLTDQLVIDAVVRVARGLGKETVAEFTGDAETAAFLRAAGVDRAQGFHLGRPVPVDEVAPILGTPAA